MLHLIQIMNHMLTKLEYTPDEVRAHFEGVQSGQITIASLLDVIGLEPANEQQIERIKKSFPRWPSALEVTLMRLEE